MRDTSGFVAAVFEVPLMTAKQYDTLLVDLERAGLGAPNGRFCHLAAAKGDGWYVVDVWESVEKLNAFAAALQPILQRQGIVALSPQLLPLYNIIG